MSLIIFFRLWVVERATTPKGGSWQFEGRYNENSLRVQRLNALIWEGVSQCGGIQIHRCPRIFLRGGVYL